MEDIATHINARDSVRLDKFLSGKSPNADYNKAEKLLCVRMAIHLRDVETLEVLFRNFNMIIDRNDSETMKMGAMASGKIYERLVHHGGTPDIEHIKIPCRNDDVETFKAIQDVFTMKNLQIPDDVIIRNGAISGSYKVLDAFTGTNRTRRKKIFDKLLEYSRTDIPQAFIVHSDLDVLGGDTNSLLYRCRGNFSVLYTMIRRSDVIRNLDSVTSLSSTDVTYSYLKAVLVARKQLFKDKHDEIKDGFRRNHEMQFQVAYQRLARRHPNWDKEDILKRAHREVKENFTLAVKKELRQKNYEKFEIVVDQHL